MSKLPLEIKATLSHQKEQLLNEAITNIQSRIPALVKKFRGN